MARYLERAEHTARLMDVNLNMMLDQSKRSADQRWLRVMAVLGITLPEDQPTDTRSLLRVLAFDSGSDASIVSCIMDARENARQVREQISSEMWEQLNRLFHEVRRANIDDILETQPVEFLHSVRNGTYMFAGITDSTMNHGEAWHFIRLGRFLERAASTARLLDHYFLDFEESINSEHSEEHLEWIGLLKSCTAFEAFCKVYTADLSPTRIAEFLLLDDEFPHSIRFAVDQLQSTLDAIDRMSPARKAVILENLAGRMRSSLSFSGIEEILSGGLHAYLEGFQRQCKQIHMSMHQVYIAYPIQSALQAS